jgi:hypothetical protein
VSADGAGEFFVGVNLPWLGYGCDFGANAWQPGGGVGQPEARRRLDEVFGRLTACGLRTVRWFVLCDGRCGIEFDPTGAPRGLDRFFARDFEAALDAASRHRLSLIPVLFDFLWFARARTCNGVQLGGRRPLLANRARRRALLDVTVRPMLMAYGREPLIRVWDLFNEPEWATLAYGSVNPQAAVRPRVMRAVLADLAALVLSETGRPATVGLASPRGMRLLRGVAMDEFQVHWYDRRAAQLYPLGGSDRPTLLGEFPTRNSASSAAEIIAAARRLGYSGALGWSARAGDVYSDLESLERAMGAPL